MRRRAYALLVAISVLMMSLAVTVAVSLDVPLRDPEGFLGPSWLRLPLLVLAAFVADVVPRSLWRSRKRRRQVRAEARRIVAEHWTRDRVVLVVVGLVGFYTTYVSYRNLKSYLPFIREVKYDYELHAFDQAVMFGHDPALLLHDLLGSGIAAHVLSIVYLAFLPMVPVSVVAWLVWSRNISFGYWYVTAQSLAWALGTASYYAVPSLGPAFFFSWIYRDLDPTGVTLLQSTLDSDRKNLLVNPLSDSVQSVAGFASLHVAIALLTALVAQYTVRHAWIRTSLWVFVAVTVVATIYFGWHYIADDLAGALIAVVAFYLAALATGQKFDRRGRSSHPTTSTASVPVEGPARVTRV